MNEIVEIRVELSYWHPTKMSNGQNVEIFIIHEIPFHWAEIFEIFFVFIDMRRPFNALIKYWINKAYYSEYTVEEFK